MIDPVTSPSIRPQSASLPEQKATANQPSAAAPPTGKAGSVTLSGHALMLSRLFSQDESTYKCEVMTDRNANNGLLIPYLTVDDRAMLEKMYDYCVANDVDVEHVDQLAGELASYRRFGANNESGELYDLGGHKLTVSFTETNRAHAERIANNMATTTIDQGFLKSELIEGHRVTSFAFLERMTEVFSTRSPDAIPPASQAPIAAYNREACNPVVTASKDVQIVIPEADYSNVNGVGHWRTPELEAAHNARFGLNGKGSGISGLLAGDDDRLREFLTMLDGYAKSKGVSGSAMNTMLDLLNSEPVKRLWAEISGLAPHDKAE